jgi:lipid-binding SYLF domain-containing protein
MLRGTARLSLLSRWPVYDLGPMRRGARIGIHIVVSRARRNVHPSRSELVKRIFVGVFTLAAFFSATGYAVSAQDMDEVQDAIAALQEADPGIASYFSDSAGYAVFPGVGKGGLGIGGARGSGLVFQGGTAIGKVKLTQISIGFQAGGQKFIEAIFFETAQALDDFTAGNFEFNAQVSAVALTSGASADARYNNNIAVFTMALGGLMYEAAVGGQKFDYEANQD